MTPSPPLPCADLEPYRALFHRPDRGLTWIAGPPRTVVTVQGDRIRLVSEGREVPIGDDAPFAAIRPRLDPARPVYFMVSLDGFRGVADPDLPLMVFIQPESEERVEGPPPFSPPTPGPVTDGHDPDPGWETEPDAEFLGRLEHAVDVLRRDPGKMILMRWYRRARQAGRHPWDLFRIYAGLEAGCGAAHFLALPGPVCSIGCSPENVFELDRGRLIFDVIAGTRGVSPRADEDRRWAEELVTDPKEIEEHDMALVRYRARLEGLCRPGSVTTEMEHGVRKLRHVRHLHSRLSGELARRLDFLDLLGDSYPPLTSYPPRHIPVADTVREPARYYAGMVGHVAAGWEAAQCYLNLRSVLVTPDALHTIGGVGVVAPSDPSREALEVRNKLRTLIEAVERWEAED